MSLPSLPTILRNRRATSRTLRRSEQEEILVSALQKDMAKAWDFLHTQAHRAQKSTSRRAVMDVKPSSLLGKQLMRIHASTVFRKLVEKHCCHGNKLTFVNCHRTIVGKPPPNLFLLQIQCQDGSIARSDC